LESLCFLCALCVSVVEEVAEIDFTTETQSAQCPFLGFVDT